MRDGNSPAQCNYCGKHFINDLALSKHLREEEGSFSNRGHQTHPKRRDGNGYLDKRYDTRHVDTLYSDSEDRPKGRRKWDEVSKNPIKASHGYHGNVGRTHYVTPKEYKQKWRRRNQENERKIEEYKDVVKEGQQGRYMSHLAPEHSHKTGMVRNKWDLDSEDYVSKNPIHAAMGLHSMIGKEYSMTKKKYGRRDRDMFDVDVSGFFGGHGGGGWL
jgi:hypothetical protein